MTSDTSSHRQNSDNKSTNPLLSATDSAAATATNATNTDTNASIPPVLPGTTDASSQAMQDAQKALSSGRLFRPRTNSAFYWAKQAEQNGDANAPRLEQTILNTAMRQVQRYRDAKNFSAASTLAGEMVEAYPNRSDVVQLSASIQSEQRDYEQQQQQQQLQAQQQAEAQRQQEIQAQQQAQAEAERQRQQQQLRNQQQAQQQQPQNQTTDQLGQRARQQPQTMQPQQAGVATFTVEHRHVGFNAFNDRFNKSFCTGTLTVSANGTIRYDCVQTQDQRCDHVTFSAADVKQAKLARGGGLHIATRNMGNWDFFGQQQQIDGALQAISQAIASQR